MSTASISYSSLKDASNEAKNVAKKLDKYADSLYSNVYKKLNKYDGSWTSNISNAVTKTNAKISELRSEQSKYESYASDLIDLRDECKRVDKAVRSRVSSLTASFKESHGIRNSNVENAISYIFTGLGNETAFGRWLGGKNDDYNAGMNYLKDSIKEWYNYEGGKELIKGVLVGLLEVAIGVLAIVGAILSGGALLVVIAGVVGGIIAVANGFANIWNEQKAYSITRNGDPATGHRRSEVNTWQDYLRSSFKFYDSNYYNSSNINESEDYRKYYREEGKQGEKWATVIDVTSFVCTAITLVSSIGNLVNRGLQWANGTAKISFQDYFKTSTYKNFFTKAWSGMSGSTKQILAAIGKGDMSFFKEAFKCFKMDFVTNFKNEFFDFKDFKGVVSSTKSILGVGKDLIDGDFSLKTIGKTALTSIIAPSVQVFMPNELTIESDQHIYLMSPTGQIKINDSPIVLEDFTGIIDDFFGKKVLDNPLFNVDGISVNLNNMFKNVSTINISVPVIDIPAISTFAA